MSDNKPTGKPKRRKRSSKWVHPSMASERKIAELEAKGLVQRDSKGRVTGIYMKDEGPTLDG